MRILGIDPGEDVGFSLFDTNQNIDMSWQVNISESTVPFLSIYSSIRGLNPSVIICEDFYHIPRYMKLSMLTAELIGVIKYYAEAEAVELIMQNRGMKTGWPAAKLKLLGLWQPGEENHDAMDALRHRLVYQEKHGMIEWPKPE